MPSRLSKLFSSKEKDSAAVESVFRTSSSGSDAPPTYQEHDSFDPDRTTAPPDLTAGFRNLNISIQGDGFPTSEVCTAHLKLLECFYRLRQAVASHDGLFGIQDTLITGQNIAVGEKTSELLARLGEKRWAIYVQRAVERFATWWDAIAPHSKMADRSILAAEGKLGHLCDTDKAAKSFLDRDTLPPVDVLMVWHAFQLNPRCYLEECLRKGRMNIWRSAFPWKAIADSINSENFTFEETAASRSYFSELTSRPWDNLADAQYRLTKCPSCRTINYKVPWTTCMEFVPEFDFADERALEAEVEEQLSGGIGFCDQDFAYPCEKCNKTISHDWLCIARFASDVRLLQDRDVPMSGTLLGIQGIPSCAHGVKDVTAAMVLGVPNQTLIDGRWDYFDVDHLRRLKSFEEIRDHFEGAMNDKILMRKVRNSVSSTMLRHERVGVRKLMSRYWDNSSGFPIELLGAVIRQGSFIEKMHHIDWLHSPALKSTMNRLITKYTHFMTIMKQHPDRMAVPTLDVDLAWHTHQLDPSRYMQYTVKLTRQFIDHDDKVAEVKLNDSFAWTSKTYQKLTGQPYSECTCWYCEAVRESHTSAASRIFNTSSVQAADTLHASEQNPAKSVHISTHNAVRPSDDAAYSILSQKQANELERHYQKACDRARRKGREPPKRNDYYYSDAYGHVVYIPAYSPYVGYIPYTPAYYPVAPGCMAVGAGAVGNCCAGTCGASVAAGGCAGSSGGGCAGGTSGGGCGGGGGGGGGCGGGGGGGGGGCGGGGGGC